VHNRPAVLRAFSELIAMAIAENNHAHAATLLGAVDARRAFLNDAASRPVCEDLESRVTQVCASADFDPGPNRARGTAMSLRELTMMIIASANA
jgi:hypothetical protein